MFEQEDSIVILMSHIFLGLSGMEKANRKTLFRGHYLLIFPFVLPPPRPTPSPLSTIDFFYQQKLLVIRKSLA